MPLGETYDIKIGISYISENPAKKDTPSIIDDIRIGENIYFIDYTSQVMEKLYDDGYIVLNAGSYVVVEAENNNQTMYQVFKNFLYGTNDATPQIIGRDTALVLVDGSAQQAGISKNGETYNIVFDIGEDAEYTEKREGYSYYSEKNASIIKSHGEEIILDPGKVKNNNEELEFDGWSTIEGRQHVDYYNGSTYRENESITLYAVWKKKEYKITYEFNVPSEVDDNIYWISPHTVSTPKKDDYIVTYVPPRTVLGYSFVGWKEDKDALEAKYIVGDSESDKISISSNITLYAHWEEKSVYINFNSNADEEITVPNAQTIKFGDSYTIPNYKPTRENYEFKGWSSSEGENNVVHYQVGDIIKDITENITLYAVWQEKIPYTVEYFANVEEEITVPDTQTIQFGEAFTIPNYEPTRENYKFKGWSTYKNAISPNYYPGQTYTSNESLKLYAIWVSAKLHTVTYNPNVAGDDTLTNLVKPIQEVAYDEDWVVYNQVPTRENYEFVYWSYYPNGSGVQIKPNQRRGMLNEDITIYAIWKEKEVIYDETSIQVFAAQNGWYRGKTDKSTITEIEIIKGETNLGYVNEEFNCDEENKGLIKGYIVGTKLYIVGKNNEQLYANPNSRAMFASFNNITIINGLENINTSNVTDMSMMFHSCKSLKNLDIRNFNTEKVTNMSSIFTNCEGLTEINLGTLNTEKVTNMESMFNYCKSLKNIDIRNFNTEKVTDMSYMFYSSGLTNLDLTSFNTSNVTNMSNMFGWCTSLKNIDIRNFNTEKVTDMSNMFYYSGLNNLDLTNFNTRNVTNMSNMFGFCWLLKNIEVGNFNTEKVTNMSYMFRNLSVTNLDLSSFNTEKVTNSEGMFYYCNKLSEVKFGANYTLNGIANLPSQSSDTIEGADGKWYDVETQIGYLPEDIPNNKEATYSAIKKDISNYPVMAQDVEWYRGRTSKETITEIEFRNSGKPEGTISEEFSAGTDVTGYIVGTKIYIVGNGSGGILANKNSSGMFIFFKNLTNIINLSILDTRNVENMEQMFGYCENLTNLNLNSFNTTNVKMMDQMFSGCKSLTNLDLSKFNTSKVTTMEGMFEDCEGLTRIELSRFDTSNVTTMQDMFHGCSSLTTLNLASFNTNKVNTMKRMFYNCSSLIELDISNFIKSPYADAGYFDHIFDGCSSMKILDISGFVMDGGEKARAPMNGCESIERVTVNRYFRNETGWTTSTYFGIECPVLWLRKR